MNQLVKKTILLIGPDKELLKRLLRPDHDVYLWCPIKPPLEFRSALKGHFQYDYELQVDEFQALWTKEFDGIIPEAVLGTSEKSVMARALVRQALGHDDQATQKAQFFRYKELMKDELSKNLIPMTPYIYCKEVPPLKEVIGKLGLPLVIKETATSGSRGLVISSDQSVLEQALLPGMLAEKFVDGLEFSVETIISNSKILFTNITEYYRKGHINIVPGRLTDELSAKLLALNEKVLKALNASDGMTHLEVYLQDDDFLFGEVALRPPGGFIMDLLEQSYDFDPWQAVIDLELGREPQLKKTAKHVSASAIFHPGEGEIKTIIGEEKLRSWPECIRLLIKVEHGDQVASREGLGQNIGHLILKAQSYENLLEKLSESEQTLQIFVTNDVKSAKLMYS